MTTPETAASSSSSSLSTSTTTAGEVRDIGPLGDALAEDVLALRASLPVKVAPVTLTGRIVTMRPLDTANDVEALYAATNGQPVQTAGRDLPAYDADALVWRFMSAGPFANVEEMRVYLHGLQDMPNGRAMAAIDTASGDLVGVATFMSNEPAHLKIELGHISYSPVVQGRGHNLEATWLMARHCFDLGYRRLEWKCNARNERSRRAALRMGFTFEGVQEAHVIVKGTSRDTAWFRILAPEWPGIDAQMQQMLANVGAPRD